MLIQQITPPFSKEIEDFFKLSRRWSRQNPRQTCVKVCSWDISETIPNKPAGDYLVFAASVKDQLAGVLAMDTENSCLCLLSVRPEAQGMGISAELIRAAESYAKAHHQFEMKAIVLMPSIPFFLKLGYNLSCQKGQPIQLQNRFFMSCQLRPRLVVAVEKFANGFDSRIGSEILDEVTEHRCQILSCPLSSGAVGYVEALVQQSAYHKYSLTLTQREAAPEQRFEANYAIRGNNAVFETSSLPDQESSWDLGRQLRDALEKGCRRLFVVLSARGPSDGGLGMLEALGARFHWDNGEISSAELEELMKTIQGITFIALCDTLETLSDHPCRMTPLARWLVLRYGPNAVNESGSMAGHGLGLTLLTLLRGKCLDATDGLLRTIDFDSRIRNADCLILASDRKIVDQHAFNPVIQALQAARRQAVRTVLFSADPELTEEKGSQLGFDAVYSLPVCKEEEAEAVSAQFCRLAHSLMDAQI